MIQWLRCVCVWVCVCVHSLHLYHADTKYVNICQVQLTVSHLPHVCNCYCANSVFLMCGHAIFHVPSYSGHQNERGNSPIRHFVSHKIKYPCNIPRRIRNVQSRVYLNYCNDLRRSVYGGEFSERFGGLLSCDVRLLCRES